MWKKLKDFYNKTHTDFSKGYVDPYEFHKTFYQILVNFKVADLSNENPPSYFNQNTIIFMTGFIAKVLCVISFYHGLMTFNLRLATEAGTYTIVMAYALLISSCTRKNVPQYHNFLRAMKDDFHFICTSGEKYRTQYFRNQLLTWKICIFACIFTASIAVGMVSFAFLSLLYFLATYKEEIGGSRPLLFPFWLPNVDFGETPDQPTSTVSEPTCSSRRHPFTSMTCGPAIGPIDHYVGNGATQPTAPPTVEHLGMHDVSAHAAVIMIQTQIVWIRQITSKVDIVIWSIEDLLMDIHPATSEEESVYYSYLIKARMRDILRHHQSMYSLMEDYAIVYKKMLMFEQKCCGSVVCLTAYCIAEAFDEGEFQAILLLLCIGTTVLHFVPCYFCTFLAVKCAMLVGTFHSGTRVP
ncbi:hypothetical protein SFRURICE_019250 [Spodoptera frugiperda]|nr:hypothetical protein SFRURICE_019250 [Spodoptera frugiperda]